MWVLFVAINIKQFIGTLTILAQNVVFLTDANSWLHVTQQ